LGVTGRIDRIQAIPGFGTTFDVGSGTVLYGGVHRGFAPPRTEDIISNSTGGAIDLDPELSWNYEAGVRHRVSELWQVEAAVFRMEYANQIVPASLAGGVGATLTNGGETRQAGFELSSRFDSGGRMGSWGDFFSNIAWTWLPVAEFRGLATAVSRGLGMSASPGTARRMPRSTY
jgi:Fe(3+) dicitrate transport protein